VIKAYMFVVANDKNM